MVPVGGSIYIYKQSDKDIYRSYFSRNFRPLSPDLFVVFSIERTKRRALERAAGAPLIRSRRRSSSLARGAAKGGPKSTRRHFVSWASNHTTPKGSGPAEESRQGRGGRYFSSPLEQWARRSGEIAKLTSDRGGPLLGSHYRRIQSALGPPTR